MFQFRYLIAGALVAMAALLGAPAATAQPTETAQPANPAYYSTIRADLVWTSDAPTAGAAHPNTLGCTAAPSQGVCAAGPAGIRP